MYKRWLTEAYKDRGALFLMNGKSREAERDSQMAILHAEGFFTTPLDPNYRRAKRGTDQPVGSQVDEEGT